VKERRTASASLRAQRQGLRGGYKKFRRDFLNMDSTLVGTSVPSTSARVILHHWRSVL